MLLSLLADAINFFLNDKRVEAGQRETEKQIYSTVQRHECISEHFLYHFRRSFNCRWIGDSPMRSHRLTGPHWAHFCRGTVTHGEYKVQLGSAGLCKFIPT